MYDIKNILGAIAAIAVLIQYTPYIVNVLRKRTRPHAFSWFVWGLPCYIVFAGQLVEGAGAGAWATGATATFCSIIFILSLFRGEKNITKLDWVCFFLALIALVLWGMTKDPLGSILLITLADVLGFVPTIRKSIAKPREETMSSYIIANVKWIFALAAMSSFSLTTLIYPLAMMGANGALIAVLITRRSTLAIKAR